MSEINLDQLIARVIVDTKSGEPLDRLAVAVRRRSELDDVAEALLDHFVAEARQAGCSWTQIGAELGVTKQAAQQRHSNERSTVRRILARVLPATWSGEWSGGGRFSDEARQALVAAEAQAHELGHGYVGTEHLLLGVLKANPSDSESARSLALLGIDFSTVRAEVLAVFGQDDAPTSGRIPFTPRTKKVLERSLQLATDAGSDAVGAEHLVLGLVDGEDGGAVGVLRSLDVDLRSVRTAMDDTGTKSRDS